MSLVFASATYPAVMTCVYRLYDVAGTLLYVGVAHDFDIRFKQHAQHKSWWPQVAHRDVTWFDNRLDALYEEARAIAVECPVHNDRPGIDRLAAVVIQRRVTEPRDLPYGRWSPLGEPIVAKCDVQAALDEAARYGSHLVFTMEGVPKAAFIPVDDYRRYCALLGEPTDL